MIGQKKLQINCLTIKKYIFKLTGEEELNLRILKIAGKLVIAFILVLVIVYLFLPRGPREQMELNDPHHVPRPTVEGEEFMVSTGTKWGTKAAVEILEEGGNAFDAGMAALLALNVSYPAPAGFAGVAPTLIYDSSMGEVKSYSGLGTAPAAADIDLFLSRWDMFSRMGFFKSLANMEYFLSGEQRVMPEMSILSQLIPASPDAILAILDRYGTKSFSEISSEAIRLAEEGFPVDQAMLNYMDFDILERFVFSVIMPYNAEIYLDGQWWRPLHHKERFTQPDLADTLQEMADAEQDALKEGATRSEALRAVRDYFYEGPIADAIVEFHEKEGGLFTYEDLADFQGHWEEPISGEFGPYTVYANATWNQGAVVPIVLQLLKEKDLKGMRHNSPEYVHTVLQAMELAMADREVYFGDPIFEDVPIEGLLSSDYADNRRLDMTPHEAFGEMPDPGDPWAYQDSSGSNRKNTFDRQKIDQFAVADSQDTSVHDDTTYLSVIDGDGNSISLTPSDFPLTPMVPETGMILGNRMIQFRLDSEHPAALEPGKRPRLTPNPGLVLKDEELFMSFGTPGGDMQPQAMIQVFLNIVVFGMDPQEAIDAPRFRTHNFPDSFSPHTYKPGVIEIEDPLHEQVEPELVELGYDVQRADEWYHEMGSVCIVLQDSDSDKLQGAADPRESSWAEGK